MPVLYGSMELRLVLPFKATESEELSVAKVSAQLSQIPEYARQQVRNLLVVSSTTDLCPLAGSQVLEFWSEVKTVLPNTKQIRLHFHLGNLVREADPHFEEMAALVTLPKIDKITVEASGCQSRAKDPSPALRYRAITINNLRAKLIATIQKGAADTKIKVIDQTTKSEGAVYDRLKPILKALHRVSGATKRAMPVDDDRLKMIKAGLLTIGYHIDFVKAQADFEHRGEGEQAMWNYCSDHYWPQSRHWEKQISGDKLRRMYAKISGKDIEQEGAEKRQLTSD